MNLETRTYAMPLKILFAILVTLVAFVVPYTKLDYWWKFIPSTIAIVTIWAFLFPQRFREFLGIKFTKIDLLSAFLFFGLFYLGTRLAVFYVASTSGISESPYPGFWWSLPIFQVFNEELLFRGLLLGFLAKSKITKPLIAIGVAFIFSLFHWLFYKFGIHEVELQSTVLLTLFFFSVAQNYFFLATGSIAIPYALHLGWNLNKFSTQWMSQGVLVSEPQGFNIIEGSWLVTGMALLLALVAYFSTRRRLSSNGFGGSN